MDVSSYRVMMLPVHEFVRVARGGVVINECKNSDYDQHLVMQPDGRISALPTLVFGYKHDSKLAPLFFALSDIETDIMMAIYRLFPSIAMNVSSSHTQTETGDYQFKITKPAIS